MLPARLGRPHVRVFRSFDSPGDGPQHADMRWFVDEGNATVMVMAATAPCVRASELAEETERVAASYRMNGDKSAEPQKASQSPPTSRAKPWWKIW